MATDTVDKFMRGRSGSLDVILEEAGVTTPAKDLIVILGAVALACFALGLVMGQPVVGLLLALMCPVVGRMMLSMLADRRRRAFGGQLDEILQMMAGSLRAGYSLPQAVATISQEAGDPGGAGVRPGHQRDPRGPVDDGVTGRPRPPHAQRGLLLDHPGHRHQP